MVSSEIKLDSIFVNGLVCEKCQSELVTDFISSSQSSDVVIRCGNCGELMSPLQNSVAVDKLAWRSLWLGLSALILLCFTGIPAMYFGVKSLLRARYTRTRPQDRRAAVAGTILGGLFGVFGSFCVFGLGGVILVTYLSNVNTSSMEQAKHILGGVANLNLPEEFVEGRASKVLGSNVFRFFDSDDNDQRNLRFDFLYFPPAMAGSVTTLNNQLRSKRLHSEANYQELSEEMLKWNLCGRSIGVTKIAFEETVDEQPATEVCLYFGYAAVESGIFGFAFVHRPANSGFTEQRIRELIESIAPPEQIDVSQRWKELSKLRADKSEEEAAPAAGEESVDEHE
jgi:hypothetical protein